MLLLVVIVVVLLLLLQLLAGVDLVEVECGQDDDHDGEGHHKSHGHQEWKF